MDDQAPTMTSDELSDQQVILIYVLQICSASLSIVGSSTIVFKIMRDRVQIGSITPYDRIMLGLSTCDVFASITYATDQFFWPSGAHVWAFGNPTACQVRQKNFVRIFEPWMHLCGTFAPITAIIGIFRGWYAKDVPCWITDPTVKWTIAAIPTLFTYLSLIINNIVIYAIVRRSLRSSGNVNGLTLEQKQLRREATTLMFLYVGSFFVTISPMVTIQVLEVYFGYVFNNAGKIYPVYVLNSLFLPLQGFFNVFVYLKPAYTRFRVANPNKSIYFVLHQALFNPEVPQLTSERDLCITSDRDLEEDPNPRRSITRRNSDDSMEDDSSSDSTA